MSTTAHEKNARASLDVGSLRCTGCGWHFDALEYATPDEVVTLVADHLERCPKRYMGHPAFGYEPHWWSLLLYVACVALGVHLEGAFQVQRRWLRLLVYFGLARDRRVYTYSAMALLREDDMRKQVITGADVDVLTRSWASAVPRLRDYYAAAEAEYSGRWFRVWSRGQWIDIENWGFAQVAISETGTIWPPRVQVFFEKTWWSLPREVRSLDEAVARGLTPLDIPGAAWQVYVVPRSFALRIEPMQGTA